LQPALGTAAGSSAKLASPFTLATNQSDEKIDGENEQIGPFHSPKQASQTNQPSVERLVLPDRVTK